MVFAVVYARTTARQQELFRRLASAEHLASLGEMSAIVAHEIRNPLTTLKGYAQLLAEQTTVETSQRHKADKVVAEALRLEELTRSLLDFVRSGSIQRVPTAPKALAQEAMSGLDRNRIILRAEGAPASFSLDPVRMRQVLVNLLQNALEIAPQDSAVEFEVREEHGRLLMAVRDRGPGIPPAAEGKLFRPFSTFKAKGTGLGLAVSKRIVELHGGTILGRNREGGGAEFELRLPKVGPL